MPPTERPQDLHRKTERACTAARGHAQGLGDELQKPASDRNPEIIESRFAALAKLRAELVRLVRDRALFLGSEDFKKLPLAERRAAKDTAVFGADPKRMLEVWNRIMRATRLCAETAPSPLYGEPLPDGSALAQRLAALDGFLVRMHEFVSPRDQQDETSESMGLFKDIPLPVSVFGAHLHAAYRVCLAKDLSAPVRFLDVGCGGGTKVLLAREYFGCADGLEYDPNYEAAARKLMQSVAPPSCNIHRGDALTFERYNDYDVIYFYQPIANPELLIELERHICSTARPGTVLIAPYEGFLQRYKDYNCGYVSGRIWLSGTSQQQADALRIKAECMGSVLVPDRADWVTQAGVLQPLCAALYKNGFYVEK
ncbi:class I SAM-dependent methyltransferase [Neptunicoccus cionae]|uniref:class I SAM-dependent methyltransferase n=1 Tax=Neptunicoccus cionae TaxID=2035344 RepID=UPI000C783821|nr:hypothetical protein [Amylibacter cionae]PLS20603.1 hypothetical protein C0U40_15865 [Amylibacter cionae]